MFLKYFASKIIFKLEKLIELPSTIAHRDFNLVNSATIWSILKLLLDRTRTAISRLLVDFKHTAEVWEPNLFKHAIFSDFVFLSYFLTFKLK